MPIHESVKAGGVPNGKMEHVHKFEVGDVVLWGDPVDYTTLSRWTITYINKHGTDVDLELLHEDMVTTTAATVDFRQPVVKIVPAHAVAAALVSLAVLEARETVSTLSTAGSLTDIALATADATSAPP